MTFEPDEGGFNNMRMAMETVLVFAAATGRTLVMPPRQRFYLLARAHEGTVYALCAWPLALGVTNQAPMPSTISWIFWIFRAWRRTAVARPA